VKALQNRQVLCSRRAHVRPRQARAVNTSANNGVGPRGGEACQQRCHSRQR